MDDQNQRGIDTNGVKEMAAGGRRRAGRFLEGVRQNITLQNSLNAQVVGERAQLHF